MVLSCRVDRQTKLLSVLRRELRLSDGLVRRLKPCNPFQVNGVPAHTDCPVFPGDTVRVTIEEPPPDFPPEEGEMNIVYEDEALIVVDKPAGLLVHPTFHRITGTLANRLLGYYERTKQASAVHVLTRLDRDTMGLVVFAKNAYIHALLVEALQAGQVEKTYFALVQGGPETESGTIDLPIGRLAPGSLLRCVTPEGKPAITKYKVLQRYDKTALLELHPVTGRTHQLRVHCSYMGYPIVGDPQYGGGEGGQQLCAGRVELVHPMSGERLRFASSYLLRLTSGEKG